MRPRSGRRTLGTDCWRRLRGHRRLLNAAKARGDAPLAGTGLLQRDTPAPAGKSRRSAAVRTGLDADGWRPHCAGGHGRAARKARPLSRCRTLPGQHTGLCAGAGAAGVSPPNYGPPISPNHVSGMPHAEPGSPCCAHGPGGRALCACQPACAV